MQSKQMSISNPGNDSSRRWTLALVPLATVLVLVPSSGLHAGTAAPAPEQRQQLVALDPMAPPAAAELSTEGKELRDRLVELLEENCGNVAAVAWELGEPRARVQQLMARLGISRNPG